MKEIFNELLHHQNHGCDCVMVSIVGDRGSAPRSSGARMLVDAQGRVCGTIGGGAVEYKSEAMAREQLDKQQSLLHDFHLNRADTDELEMVCGGNVTVLFRFISGEDEAWKRLAAEVMGSFEGKNYLWLVEDLTDLTALPLLLSADTLTLDGTSRQLCRQLQGEKCLNFSVEGHDYYAEPLPRGERVIIFGGGHICRELVPLLNHLDFRVTVFDDRPAYADPAALPGVSQTIVGDYRDISRSLQIGPDDYIVVMTNGHANDFDVQSWVMQRSFAYLGVIGSRAKTAILNKRFLAAGFTQEQLDEVHTPIGTAIKAQTPAEIAVSIAGELIMVRAEKRQSGPSSCPV